MNGLRRGTALMGLALLIALSGVLGWRLATRPLVPPPAGIIGVVEVTDCEVPGRSRKCAGTFRSGPGGTGVVIERVIVNDSVFSSDLEVGSTWRGRVRDPEAEHAFPVSLRVAWLFPVLATVTTWLLTLRAVLWWRRPRTVSPAAITIASWYLGCVLALGFAGTTAVWLVVRA